MSDLISRQDAIDAVVRESQVDGAYGYMDTKSIVDLLHDMPSALQEQKTGKWIGNEFGECSACGHKGCASDIWDRCEKHYCPNCGTLLEEEQ